MSSSGSEGSPGPAGSPGSPGPSEGSEPRVGEEALRFSHSGYRYLLGYGQDFFGVWDRQVAGGPVARWPRTDDGWAQAWTQFSTWEPRAVPVPPPSGSSQAAPAAGSQAAPAATTRVEPPATSVSAPTLGAADVPAPTLRVPAAQAPPAAATPAPGATPPSAAAGATTPAGDIPAPAGPTVGEGAVRFSHSGFRYLMGYGADFFGIWDREVPGGPLIRFPRTDEGWSAAWNRYSAMEPRAVAVSQGATPAPDMRLTGDFRSGHRRSRWTVALLILSAVTAGFLVLALIGALGVLSDARDVGFLSQSRRDDLDAVFLGVSVLDLLTLAVTALAWCQWQHRAHTNLRALGAADLRISPGWAVGWWFVPFANIVMPFKAMRELWQASEPQSGAVDWKATPSTRLLGWWWAAWLGTRYVLPGITLQFGSDIDDLLTRTWLLIGAQAFTVVAAILAIALVRGIDVRQEEKHRRLADWSRGTAAS